MSSSDGSDSTEAPDVSHSEGEHGAYVRTLDDDDPLPVDRHADAATRARILRSISRVTLTDAEVQELDARLQGTSRVLRTFRSALQVELTRIIAKRKNHGEPDGAT
ncbi:MAG: hypothetical protein HOV80_31185 [Polyangiaceae bacterium]|nr:hypothetical protein [Polyangiaceae bacterium]